MIGGIAIGDMVQRLITDPQVFRHTLPIAGLVRISFWREERFTAFYKITHVVEPVGRAEVRVVIACIIGSGALLDQAEALGRVVVIVDQIFKQLLSVLLICR